MKNKSLEKLNSIIKIKIEGKNINNYIKRHIIHRKINIIELIPISYKEVHLIIDYKNYKRLTKNNTIYKVSIIDSYGKLKLKEIIKKNYILITFFILGIIILIILSNLIFKIEIIHQNKEIKNLIKTELEKNGIKKYKFKKKYKELEHIEDKILENNKDKLEWIEIIETGTKYTVRIEERKINKIKQKYKYQSITATKSAIITRINAIKGEKVKNVNDYVNKGDTIISGYITQTDNKVSTIMAKGDVYGEVWYKVNVDYPFVYQEENLTGKNKTIYMLHFINKRISIFDFKKFKSFWKSCFGGT